MQYIVIVTSLLIFFWFAMLNRDILSIDCFRLRVLARELSLELSDEDVKL